MTITTKKSGYIISFKDYLTFGQRRELEKILVGNTKVNPQTKTINDIDPKVLYEMQDKAVEMLITEIRMGDKIIKSDFAKVISEWPEEDGQEVYNKINEITTPKTNSGEKK